MHHEKKNRQNKNLNLLKHSVGVYCFFLLFSCNNHEDVIVDKPNVDSLSKDSIINSLQLEEQVIDDTLFVQYDEIANKPFTSNVEYKTLIRLSSDVKVLNVSKNEYIANSYDTLKQVNYYNNLFTYLIANKKSFLQSALLTNNQFKLNWGLCIGLSFNDFSKLIKPEKKVVVYLISNDTGYNNLYVKFSQDTISAIYIENIID